MGIPKILSILPAPVGTTFTYRSGSETYTETAVCLALVEHTSGATQVLPVGASGFPVENEDDGSNDWEVPTIVMP